MYFANVPLSHTGDFPWLKSQDTVKGVAAAHTYRMASKQVKDAVLDTRLRVSEFRSLSLGRTQRESNLRVAAAKQRQFSEAELHPRLSMIYAGRAHFLTQEATREHRLHQRDQVLRADADRLVTLIEGVVQHCIFHCRSFDEHGVYSDTRQKELFHVVYSTRRCEKKTCFVSPTNSVRVGSCHVGLKALHYHVDSYVTRVSTAEHPHFPSFITRCHLC